MEDNQKVDAMLNLAIDVTLEEREQSRQLSVGYNAEEKTWRVIVKYIGDLREIENLIEGSQVIPLFNQYGIVRIPEGDVDLLASLPQIQFVEKPKQLYFSLDVGRSVSCINSVQRGVIENPEIGVGIQPDSGLTGRGVLVGIIDSGERVIIMSC